MKIAIVGGSPNWHEAPFDEEYEIWVLGNQLDRYEGKRVDRIFEIHDWLGNQDPKYPQWLVDKNIPLVVGEKFPIKAHEVWEYPYEEIREEFGDLYLTSSPAYMLVYALYTYGNKVEEIGIYGVEMAVDDHEYFHQRPCMEYWIGYARAKGIKVTIPECSSLAKSSYVEGCDWVGYMTSGQGAFSERELTAMALEHTKLIDAAEEEKRKKEFEIVAHDAAAQVYKRLAKVARAGHIDIKTMKETVDIK